MSSNENTTFYDKLKTYQNKLLQLGKSNRCVCLSRIYNKHNFDLSRIIKNHPKKINDLIEQSFKQKKPVCILPDSDFSEEADVMRRHLKDLSRNIKQLEDETGSQYCYLGFPFLEGHLDQEHYIRGPLVLFPISVYAGREGTTSGWFIKFANVSPIFNHTMFAVLKKIGGYEINDKLESDFEDMISSFIPQKDQNIEKFFIENILNILTLNGINIDSLSLKITNEFNTTLTLNNITSDEIASLDRQPLKILNYKVIGSFPQGESAIYQDYENLISKIQNGGKNNFIADILGETPSPIEFEEDIDDSNLEDLDKVRDMDLNLILPSDSSQDQVVLSSQNRKITLIRGPPGTGKSQVIVNIISNAISKGQTVLVVCQKRAALEVVHQRLGERGLDKYTVLLNKEKEDRANMYHQLKQILEGEKNYETEGQEMLQTTSSKIDDLIKKHSEISHALSKKYFGGVTIRDLYTKSSSEYLNKLNLNGIGNDISYPELENILFDLSQIQENYKKFEDKNYVWKNRKDFSQKRSSDRTKIKEILECILEKSKNCIILEDKQNQDKLIEFVEKYASINSEITRLNEKNNENTESIKKLSDIHNISITTTDLDETIKCANGGMMFWNKFRDFSKIKQIKENHIIEDSLEKQIDLVNIFSEIQIKKSFWKKLTDSETKRKEKLQKEFLEKHENIGKTSDELKNRLQNGLDLWNIVTDDIEKQYLFEKSLVLPNDSDQSLLLQTLKTLNSDLKEVKENSEILQINLESLRTIFEKYNLFFDKNEEITQVIIKVKNGKEILNQINLFSEFVHEKEIKIIFEKYSNVEELSLHMQNLFNHLSDFDRLQSHDIRKLDLSPILQDILNQCMSKIDVRENWIEIVKQEIYHYWIETIEQDHPILKAGYFEDYKQNQKKLSELFEKKSDLLVKQIINNIESNVDFRPGMGIKRTQRETEYNALNHELGKKRKVKPVRKLLEQYEHILFDIAPCWLASPEMVSNIFPLEQNLFDLVIVDEASQLAAERSLPFLYRGERLIIAGDEMQLKPHDLFRIKEEENEEGEDDTMDIESLLLLAKRRYSTNTLQWHYRSRWQQLIDFSNHAFYNGVLQISPNSHVKTIEPPIQWVDCPEGIWENRSNVAEASKVVDTLYNILQNSKGGKIPTIGIITFNDQQKNVIIDEIENRCKKDPAFEDLYNEIANPVSGKKDDEIFVRNIENVQGDERDIIIFSVGYAKDPTGNFRLQFGTLNQDGGENRLNVAITRASKKIIVVCSINPHDMKVEGTKNPGPKRLKDFLEYANAVNNGDSEKVEQILKSLSSGMNKTQQQTKHFDSEFEELVHDRLESIGYTVETQVGQSGYRIDLGIIHPNDPSKYILGVECDGAMFHSGKSVRERDVMRQKFLERRDWNIDRIWSRNWWRNPDKEIQRIKERVDSLL